MLCLKKFLDETAQKIGNLPSDDVDNLFSHLVELILSEKRHDPNGKAEEAEEILKFCSASVLEMNKASRKSLLKLFQNTNRLKNHSNFHVLVNAITSKMVKEPISTFESNWIDSVLDALISGLTTIESETISLSGSSIIKLLKWESAHDETVISKRLADHDDFVAILTADMCAMFSRMEENDNLIPFIRIVRFCELVIDASGKDSGLREAIVKTVQDEFIGKVYRTTLKTTKDKTQWHLNWSNELLKSCHRGNELVKPLVNEVFSIIEPEKLLELLGNVDFIEIISNERSRPIESIVNLLFHDENVSSGLSVISNTNDDGIIDDLVYRNALRRQLESFEQFRILKLKEIRGLTPLSVKLFSQNRRVLLNWLPYSLKVTKITTSDWEIRMFVDISGKLLEYLEL